MDNKITLVTGLWDLQRGNLDGIWKRDFQDHYVMQLKNLLDVPFNLVIFGEYDIESVIWEKRSKENTTFIYRPKDWFKQHFYNEIQSIRTNPEWYNQAGWLRDSAQGSLEMYNPVVMSKMFMLHDAANMVDFGDTHYFWIDAGLTTTVSIDYIKNANYKKLTDSDLFTFVGFPYKATDEIHGFSYPKINEYANGNVQIVGRGGFFGGSKNSIKEINGEYYNMLGQTLGDGYMGTEESIFSILIYKFPELVQYYEIEENGLVYKFFHDLSKEDYQPKRSSSPNISAKVNPKVGLYVLGYNSPKQFKVLINSMLKYDKRFFDRPNKYLINNSTDPSTFDEYDFLCEEFGFTQIKKDNIGICGGRQFIAEHFENETDLDYYFFFEDDMAFTENRGVCKNGFNRRVSDLYHNCIKIMQKKILIF